MTYGYDDLYRLTSENVLCGTGTPACAPGSVSYTYDPVGNRLQRNSTLPAIPPTGLLSYDANDRTSTDPYDTNGNLLSSGAGSNVYDFENRLVQAGGVKLTYDGDGNRVSETVAGVATKYLVADQNLTGYAQVIAEFQNGIISRAYSYGLTLISQKLVASSSQLSFYGFDGHGSVRFLTSSTGAITDTYDYDAFGNLISQTGTTPNNYLFAGEQFDPALGIYYNRARYYDQRQGRFWTADTDEGVLREPLTLHLYTYVTANPVNFLDRSGHEEIAEMIEVSAEVVEAAMREGRAQITALRALRLFRQAAALLTASAVIASSIATSAGFGGGGASALNGQEGEGLEVETTVYRDTDGTNPGAFSFTPPTYPDLDEREISLLEIPKRDRKYIVPFRVRYRTPKTPRVTVGGIIDVLLVPLYLQVRYSPKDTPGHWSLLGNLLSDDQQQTVKQALASFAKQNALRTGN